MAPIQRDWTVICDFDGTISNVDVTDAILEAFADPSWLDIEKEWKSGQIGSQECLSRQIALIDAVPHALHALVDTVAIDTYFTEFADFCAAAGVRLVIVSDGFNEVIGRILARHGLGDLPVFANHLIRDAQTYRVASPNQDADCCTKAGTCKCAVIGDIVVEQDHAVLFVGDGRSDFCAAGRMADVVAAKSSLLAHMRLTGKDCVPFNDFHEVRLLLSSLLASTAASVHPQSEVSYELI